MIASACDHIRPGSPLVADEACEIRCGVATPNTGLSPLATKIDELKDKKEAYTRYQLVYITLDVNNDLLQLKTL